MMMVLEWILVFVAGAVVCGRVTRHLARVAPLRRTNHRGLEVATAGGMGVLLGILTGLGILAGLSTLIEGRLAADVAASTYLLSAAAGFGLLGLWDDIAGSDEERGWRAHLGALRAGRATAGAIKLAGGTMLAVVLVAPRGGGLLWTLIDAAIVALGANLFNLLDVRPGRACKTFLVFAGTSWIAALILSGLDSVTPALAAAMGAVATFLRHDLRERAMLGNLGANAIGALLGIVWITIGDRPARAIMLVALVVLHAMADRPGLSAIFDHVRPLRAFDRAGRVQGDELPVRGR